MGIPKDAAFYVDIKKCTPINSYDENNWSI
jgi:hypothetical protein